MNERKQGRGGKGWGRKGEGRREGEEGPAAAVRPGAGQDKMGRSGWQRQGRGGEAGVFIEGIYFTDGFLAWK